MTLRECAQLLAAVAVFDGRPVDQAAAQVWHTVIGDLDYADACEALRRHVKAGAGGRIMPAHIIAAYRDIRRARHDAAAREERRRELAARAASGVDDRPGRERVHAAIEDVVRRWSVDGGAGYSPAQRQAIDAAREAKRRKAHPELFDPDGFRKYE